MPAGLSRSRKYERVDGSVIACKRRRRNRSQSQSGSAFALPSTAGAVWNQ